MSMKQLLIRINATKGMSKIMSAYKMIAATRLKQCEPRLAQARPIFNSMAKGCFSPVDGDTSFDGEAFEKPEGSESQAFVLAASDKGLCGGVNSYGVKTTLHHSENMDGGKDAKFFLVGEKSRSVLSRTKAENIAYSSEDNFKEPYNFAKACIAAERVISADADDAYMVYNHFVNTISYDPKCIHMPNFSKGESERFGSYDVEPEVRSEVMDNLYQFAVASVIYGGVVDNVTSEWAQRMQATENASNNCTDRIDSLTLMYNRKRQAKITTELTEIVAGAESVGA